jgi:hypothetical protein
MRALRSVAFHGKPRTAAAAASIHSTGLPAQSNLNLWT